MWNELYTTIVNLDWYGITLAVAYVLVCFELVRDLPWDSPLSRGRRFEEDGEDEQ